MAYAPGARRGEREGGGEPVRHLGGSAPNGTGAGGCIETPQGSCVAAPMSSTGWSLRLLILLARALLNMPSGTRTSPTPGIESIVPRPSSVVWLKYAA